MSDMAHTSASISCIYDRVSDVYRPMEQQDVSFFNAESETVLDAFGRIRVSNPLTMLDSSHRYGDNGLWVTASGQNGSKVFNANQGLIELNTTNASGSFVKRETTKVFAYQSGKSLLVMNSFVMSAPKINLRQRIGYFSDQNGLFIELNGTETPTLVRRSIVSGSIQDLKIPQSEWNGDKLDGTGPSKISLDLTKAQILWTDIEWLGVGTVRMGFVVNGKFIICHSFHHANLTDSTYITTASLPVRYEIENMGATSGNSILKQICSTVMSEGGYELRGAQREIDLPVASPRDCTVANTFYPVISIKLKSSKLDAIAVLSAITAVGIGNNGVFNWKLIANGVTSGGSWIESSPDSTVEYNISGSSFNSSGAKVLGGGYFVSTTQSTSPIYLMGTDLFKFQLERNGLSSTPYELTLIVASKTAGDDVYASMDWEEVVR